MKTLLTDIRELILSARKAVAHSVDLIQVFTNFEIGRRIVEHEQEGTKRVEYGKKILRELAADLTSEFGNGFSKSNLEYMRRFYLLYYDRKCQIAQTPSGQLLTSEKTQTPSGKSVFPAKLQTLSAQFTLSWSHYVFLMGIKDAGERSFYEIEATGQNWSLRELKRQFNSGLYERLALSRDKEGIRKLAREGQLVTQPQDLLKEPYVLEFLYYDRFVKLKNEHPTVGIILCKKKHDALVEITLPTNANIYAKEYKLYLPDKEVLKQKLVEWSADAERSVGGNGKLAELH